MEFNDRVEMAVTTYLGDYLSKYFKAQALDLSTERSADNEHLNVTVFSRAANGDVPDQAVKGLQARADRAFGSSFDITVAKGPAPQI